MEDIKIYEEETLFDRIVMKIVRFLCYVIVFLSALAYILL